MLIKLAVGGSALFTKIKIAFSALSLTRFRITYTNCPTVKSLGTRYFFLSKSGTSDFGDFSTMTGILSGYFWRMREDSYFLCSVVICRSWITRDGESKTSSSVSFREYSQKAPSSFFLKLEHPREKETFEKKKSIIFSLVPNARVRASALALRLQPHVFSPSFFRKQQRRLLK